VNRLYVLDIHMLENAACEHFLIFSLQTSVAHQSLEVPRVHFTKTCTVKSGQNLRQYNFQQ
jgi:hypothetical protein